MRKEAWIDISVTLKSGMVHWPGDPAVSIRRTQNINKGNSANVSLISMGSHSGTHMDAPLHFIRRGKGLDSLPFKATIGPARILEIKDDNSIRPKELFPYRIKRGERLIFKTRNSNYWKRGRFVKNFIYISAEVAQYLVAKGVRTVGVDYLSVGGYYGDGAKTHRILLNAGIWIIEGLDLSHVRPGNYHLVCLPLKILNSDGAPARAVILPENKR